MHNILYFPHYTPSTARLRSLLLFYDELRTIVPHVDQSHVANREHVAELVDVGCKIDFFDPSYRYSDWVYDEEVGKVFDRLVAQCSKKATKTWKFDKIRFDEWGVADWDQEDEINKFVRSGWSMIAAQKIPEAKREELRHKRVAIPMRMYRNPETGQVVEENPVLMYPEIGDFILARLAREISKQERVPAVTFENDDFCNQAYSPSRGRSESHALLMSAVVSLSIPNDIVEMRSGEYAEVRASYAPARLKIESMVREITENYRLESIADFDHLGGAISDAASDIERRVQAALNERRTWRHRAYQVLNQNVVWGVGGALAGYLTGGALGAAAGGIISPLAADLANKLAPPKTGYEMVETLASIRGSIDRGVKRSRVSLPSYMI